MYRSSTSTLSIPRLICSILLDVFVMLPLLLLVSPWLLYKVMAEGRGVGDFRERVGLWQISLPVRPRIWVHAASVGEVHAARPLLAELQRSHPGKEFLLTTMTTGAREMAEKTLPGVEVRLLPIDLGHFMFSMIRKMRPSMLILVELEYWPQLLLACRAYSIPVAVVNGRISDRGLSRWKSWSSVLGWMSRIPELILARSAEDADRFIQIGTPAEKVRVAGNLKYDVADLSLPIRKINGSSAFTWMASCTHPGEESIVLEIHRQLLDEIPDARLILAPRHIERCDGLARQIREADFSVSRWSDSQALPRVREVLLIDRLGVLMQTYGLAEAVFVGGSLVDRGGHNFLEPVLCGCFTCHGPHLDNFRDMESLLAPWNVAEEVPDAEGLARWIGQRANSREEIRERQKVAQDLRNSLGGISREVVSALKPWIE
jgi:3-deoxy-D-manno-octulosonic-acid transferase